MLQDMKEAEDESPLTTNGDSCSSEEELFHLEMSNDEGSGGKRPKYHHPEDESEAASSSSSSKSAKDNELHGFGNPVIQAAMPSQKRARTGQLVCARRGACRVKMPGSHPIAPLVGGSCCRALRAWRDNS